MEISRARSQMIRYGSLVGMLTGTVLTQYIEPDNFTKLSCLIIMMLGVILFLVEILAKNGEVPFV